MFGLELADTNWAERAKARSTIPTLVSQSSSGTPRLHRILKPAETTNRCLAIFSDLERKISRLDLLPCLTGGHWCHDSKACLGTER